MGLVTNVQGLYVTRLLLGAFEVSYSIYCSNVLKNFCVKQAGVFPGLNFVFTMWYTREELNFRVALFVMGTSLSGKY